MCERCADLEERVAWLESELRIQADATDYSRLRTAMRRNCSSGANPWARKNAILLVITLFRAAGRVRSRPQLMEAIPPLDRAREDNRINKCIDVWVCAARKMIGPGVIETVPGRGYRLTDGGVAKVAAILGDAPAQASQVAA